MHVHSIELVMNIMIKLILSETPFGTKQCAAFAAMSSQYVKTRRKHLGDSRDAVYKEVLDDCIFDLCNGGGETSAELAAEIYHAE